jgi:hypothetical protein
MRRALALFLLSLFSFPLIAPILAAESRPGLPACCRRDGKHHCALTDRQDSPAGPSARATLPKCPQYPQGGTVPASSPSFLPVVRSVAGLAPFFQPLLERGKRTLPRTAICDSSRKRGPPANLLVS